MELAHIDLNGFLSRKELMCEQLETVGMNLEPQLLRERVAHDPVLRQTSMFDGKNDLRRIALGEGYQEPNDGRDKEANEEDVQFPAQAIFQEGPKGKQNGPLRA